MRKWSLPDNMRGKWHSIGCSVWVVADVVCLPKVSRHRRGWMEAAGAFGQRRRPQENPRRGPVCASNSGDGPFWPAPCGALKDSSYLIPLP